MELSEIATLSGKSGLFRVLKPTRTGVILESLDDKKTKLVANAQHRVSVLEEISIYTTTEDGSVPLKKIFHKIAKEFDDDPGLDNNASADELKAFIRHILPEYDQERVYTSDIKKLVSWYKILYKHAPEVLTGKDENDS
ncbi:MAG: DUF5606 domain-containing protein [Cytophagales bacterium]|nr:DUF5606 domain-containing protein [Cytophagales bacterium]